MGMKSVLNKIFSSNIDESVHHEFLKFSRGKFENRYLLEGKKQKDSWSIKTSSEFANLLVDECLREVTGEVNIKGAIICTFDLRNEVKFKIERVKQFMGVKQFIVDCVVKPSDILDLMVKQPRAFYALSFSSPLSTLKIKQKAPKSGKPASKGEAEPKADFCSIKTSNKKIIEDLFFDFPNFQTIRMKHTVEINDVILPHGISDPVKIREMAKKKGKIIREMEVDGKKERKEKEFEA